MTRRMTLAHRAPEPQCPGQCYLAPVSTQVIVLNGVSSSDKTSIARCLQGMLTTPRLLLDIDDLIRAMPDEGIEDGSLLHVGETGEVEVAVSRRPLSMKTWGTTWSLTRAMPLPSRARSGSSPKPRQC